MSNVQGQKVHPLPGRPSTNPGEHTSEVQVQRVHPLLDSPVEVLVYTISVHQLPGSLRTGPYRNPASETHVKIVHPLPGSLRTDHRVHPF